MTKTLGVCEIQKEETHEILSRQQQRREKKKYFAVTHVGMIRCTSCVCMCVMGKNRFLWLVWLMEYGKYGE